MELEGKSFVEAAEQLAQRFNIDVPRIEESPELRRARGERVAMLDLNKIATAFYREVADQLWARAGCGPADVQVAQFYENFTGPVLMAIAEMGFCAPEELNDFVADGNLCWPDGGLPINTAGGNLAEGYIHGFGNMVEAVRQVRGDSTCQVADVELSLSVAGPGFAPGSAVLFGKG